MPDEGFSRVWTIGVGGVDVRDAVGVDRFAQRGAVTRGALRRLLPAVYGERFALEVVRDALRVVRDGVVGEPVNGVPGQACTLVGFHVARLAMPVAGDEEPADPGFSL